MFGFGACSGTKQKIALQEPPLEAGVTHNKIGVALASSLSLSRRKILTLGGGSCRCDANEFCFGCMAKLVHVPLGGGGCESSSKSCQGQILERNKRECHLRVVAVVWLPFVADSVLHSLLHRELKEQQVCKAH